MSTVSSTTSSGVNYAMQLAKASALKRTLNSLGSAIQSGDMTSANTILTQFIKDNPQYAPGTSGAAQSQDPISKDFQTLATAVGNKQAGAAQSAWKKVKADLSKDGVNLTNSAQSTAAVLAQSKVSMDQQILSSIFGTSSTDSSSLSALLGGTSDSNSSTSGVSSSLLSQWVTYQNGGTTKPTTASTTLGSILNKSA